MIFTRKKKVRNTYYVYFTFPVNEIELTEKELSEIVSRVTTNIYDDSGYYMSCLIQTCFKTNPLNMKSSEVFLISTCAIIWNDQYKEFMNIVDIFKEYLEANFEHKISIATQTIKL